MATRYVYLTGGREVTLDDPTDAYAAEQIKQHWAATFPELSAATWDTKEVEGVKVVTFAKKVGTKGAFKDSLQEDLTEVDFLPLLAIRTGDTLHIEPWDGPGDLSLPTYAVALFEAPDLARLGVPISPVCKKTAAVAVGVSKDGWGWMPWDANMKNMVSDLLDQVGAKPGQWFKLTISYTSPFKPEVGRLTPAKPKFTWSTEFDDFANARPGGVASE